MEIKARKRKKEKERGGEKREKKLGRLGPCLRKS